jgi:hypothetical protein
VRVRPPSGVRDAGRDHIPPGRQPREQAAVHHAVWLKYCVASSGLAMVVTEQATEAFSSHHVPRVTTHCPLLRDESVVETLMIAFGMIVGEVLVEHTIQGAFPQYDHRRQGLCLDGAYEPFTVGIEIRTPWRQDEWLHATVLEQAIKGLREFGIPIVDQIPFPEEEPERTAA